MKLEVAGLSHVGQVRENNEDALGQVAMDSDKYRADKGALYIVADGMGGHRGGEIASHLAVETIISDFYNSEMADPVEALRKAFSSANRVILERSLSDVSLFGMGTTCTAMLARDGGAYFAHVGDSRAYLFRNGAIEQLTEDHSLVGEMVRSGIISDEDAQTHPKRNVITRSLGTQENIATDINAAPHKLQEGDVYLLCSDGLTSLVSDAEVQGILQSNAPREACSALIDLANQKGGKDNITVQVIRVNSED